MRADPRGHHRQRAGDQGDRAADQAGLGVCVRSRHRPAGVADRRASGREGRRAGRVVFADAAVPDQAAGLRASGRVDRRSDRLHAGAARRGGRSSSSRYKIGPIFTPPVVSKWEGPLATLMLPTDDRRRELAGRRARSGDRTCFYIFSNTTRRSALGLVRPIRARSRHGLRRGHGAAIPNAAPPPAAQRAGGGGGRRGRRPAVTVQGLPLVKPPYGRITAIDLNKGELVWQIAHGETPDNIKNHPGAQRADHPAHRPAGPHRRARHQDAGDRRRGRVLHDADGQRGAMLRAYDKATGQGSRRGLHAGAADRIADDLHAERQAVPRRRHQRCRLLAASWSRSGCRRKRFRHSSGGGSLD